MGVTERVLRQVGDDAFDRLATLPGADLTTLLLALMRRRTEDLSPAEVLRRYREDRFVKPAQVPFGALRAAEDRALAALKGDVEVVQLAPLAPLGTCSSMSTVDQNKVVSTIRGNEVAADPTNALALEAAVRRRAGRQTVRLAAIQRVVRAQVFDGARSFVHFTLFARVSAWRGRDDEKHLDEHLSLLREVCQPAEIRQTHKPVYYSGSSFKVFRDGVEMGDGGFVDWSRRLLSDRKERMLISGIGLDRVAGA